MDLWDNAVRLIVATVCGGIIGIERGRKSRPAGFRTYILVCVGAALAMMLGSYIVEMNGVWSGVGFSVTTSDVSRLGAQVINGIGFLGAGTIIVTGKQQVKGMTTAAGLWASACMGLAIGMGFYKGALIGCLLIIITMVFLTKFESFIMSRSRNINICVEFESIDDLSAVIEQIRSQNVRIFDVEIIKAKNADTKYPGAIFSLGLPKKLRHPELITKIAYVESVRGIEEL